MKMTLGKVHFVLLPLTICLLADTSKALLVFPKLSPTAGSILRSKEFTDEADLKCIHDSRLVEMAAGNGTLWAWRMMDASADVRGVLWGARHHLGSFDSCLSLEVPVRSQYCLVEMTLPPPKPGFPLIPPWDHFSQADLYQDARHLLQGAGLRTGWPLPGKILVALCVPSSCRSGLLQRALEQSVNQTVKIVIDDKQCIRAEEQKSSFSSTIFWLLIGSLSALTLLAGSLDRCEGWLSAWNWRHHLRVLSAPDPPLNGMNLSSLSGMRFTNTILLTCVHRAFHTSRLPAANMLLTTDLYMNVLFTPATNGFLLVDTCFFFSGLLMSLTVNKSSFLAQSALLRYLRLTPSYLLVVFMYGAVLEGLGTGPLWNAIVARESQACRKWWWSNALYVNNYIHGDPQEYSSWSLAVDMQLFLVGAWLLRRLHGRYWTGFLILVLSALPLFLATLAMDWPALMRWTPEVLANPYAEPMWFRRYVPSHMRAAPYVIGVILGVRMQTLQSQGKKLSALTTHVLTWGGCLLLALTMSSSVIWWQPNADQGSMAAALYATLTPIVWTASLVALVIALIFGTQTLARDFLSWQPLVTLARLSYGVYLVHFGVQLVQAGAQRTGMHICALNIILNSIGDLGVSLILSLVLYILVEAPVREISKKFLRKKRSPHPSEIKSQLNNGLSSDGNNNEKAHLL